MKYEMYIVMEIDEETGKADITYDTKRNGETTEKWDDSELAILSHLVISVADNVIRGVIKPFKKLPKAKRTTNIKSKKK